MVKQTWTRIPFLVVLGDESAKVVMLDTAQIFLVVGSCGRNNELGQHSFVYIVLKYTNNTLTLWWKLKLYL